MAFCTFMTFMVPRGWTVHLSSGTSHCLLDYLVWHLVLKHSWTPDHVTKWPWWHFLWRFHDEVNHLSLLWWIAATFGSGASSFQDDPINPLSTSILVSTFPCWVTTFLLLADANVKCQDVVPILACTVPQNMNMCVGSCVPRSVISSKSWTIPQNKRHSLPKW